MDPFFTHTDIPFLYVHQDPSLIDIPYMDPGNHKENDSRTYLPPSIPRVSVFCYMVSLGGGMGYLRYVDTKIFNSGSVRMDITKALRFQYPGCR